MSSEVKSNAAKWAVTAAVICAFLAIDFFTPQWGDDDWARAVLVGICVGQVNLIATWAALGPGNIVLRLPWSSLLGLFMWYSLVLGFRVEPSFISLADAALLGIIVLGAVGVLQIPLWIAAKVFRWRLVGPGDETREASSGPLQFQLRHMMLGILLVSMALAPARAVLPQGDIADLRLYEYGELIPLLTAATLCNLVVTVPCIWGAFLRKGRLLGVALVWLFYCACVTGIEFAAFCAVLGSPSEGRRVSFVMYLLNVSQCATVFGTLRVFRAIGFRLIRV